VDDIDKRVRGADGRTYSSIRHFNGSGRDEQLDRSGLRDVRITVSFFSSRRFGFGSLSPGVSSSLFFPFHPSYPDPSFLPTSISLSPTPSLDLVVALRFFDLDMSSGLSLWLAGLVRCTRTEIGPVPRPSKNSTLERFLLSR
jgi:hypothetical protein